MRTRSDRERHSGGIVSPAILPHCSSCCARKNKIHGVLIFLSLAAIAVLTPARAATNSIHAMVSSCKVTRGKFDRGAIEISATVTGSSPKERRPVFAVYVLAETKDHQLFCFTRVGVLANITKGEMQLESPRCASNYDDDPGGNENPAYHKDATGVASAFRVVSLAQPQVDATLFRSIRVSGVANIEVQRLNMATLSVIATRAELWMQGQPIAVFASPIPPRPPSQAIPSDWHIFKKHSDQITYSVHSNPIL